MKLILPGCAASLLLALALPCAAQVFTLPQEFWQAPRSGSAVRAEPQLQQAFAAYLGAPRTRWLLHHQKRDESIAQAEELRGWLIALGVEAERIELADDNTLNTLKLEIVEPR